MTTKRILAAVSIATALALPACGGGSDEADQVSSRATTTSTAGDGATTTTAASGEAPSEGGAAAGGSGSGSAGGQTSAGGTDPGTGGGGSTPSGSSSGGGGTPAAASAPAPAKAGTYRYDTDGSTTTSGAVNQTRELPSVTTLKIEAADGTRQRSVRDMRDDEGDGTVTTTVLQYRADGVYLESLKIQATTAGFTVTYDFRPSPAKLVAPAGTEVGDHLEFSMESTDGSIQADVAVDVQARETLTIGGQSVDTFKVRTHTTFEGDVEGESTSTSNMSPTHSLTVREHSVSDARLGITESHTEYTATLQSLNPS